MWYDFDAKNNDLMHENAIFGDRYDKITHS